MEFVKNLHRFLVSCLHEKSEKCKILRDSRLFLLQTTMVTDISDWLRYVMVRCVWSTDDETNKQYDGYKMRKKQGTDGQRTIRQTEKATTCHDTLTLISWMTLYYPISLRKKKRKKMLKPKKKINGVAWTASLESMDNCFDNIRLLLTTKLRDGEHWAGIHYCTMG